MNLLRTLFMGSWRPGSVPAYARRALTEEGVLCLAEDLPGSISYLSYGRVGRPGPATEAVMGAIVVSELRFVVWAGRHEYIDVAKGHPVRDTVTVNVDQPGQVCISYPAEHFSRGRTGTIEVRLRTEQAEKIDLLLNPTA
jgi:hypothetical protein